MGIIGKKRVEGSLTWEYSKKILITSYKKIFENNL